MTVYYQPLDGANGAAIGWADSEAMGAPVYKGGAGTATYTTTDPIRGSASAQLVAASGQSDAFLVLGLDASTKKLRAHAYVRVPAGIDHDTSTLFGGWVAGSLDRHPGR